MRRILPALGILLLACLTLSPALPASPTIPATLTPGATPEDLPGVKFSVQFHPDGGLHVGDQVSLEVIPPPGMETEGKRIRVQDAWGKVIGEGDFASYGIAGRRQVTLYWAWDTRGLSPGDHTLTFTLMPDGVSLKQSIRLLPRALLPPPENQSQWAMVKSECCRVYYLTFTAAERDLAYLVNLVDQVEDQVAEQLALELSQPITVTLIPRVLGHGGFAGEEATVSYLDRNYAGVDLERVLHHELVHILDARLGGELRPSMLTEGLAVYLSGGHFKAEPLLRRAATLLKSGRYIPLRYLIEDFYSAQHEISYLEAGALVAYMVNRWGWEAFDGLYRDIHPSSSGSLEEALDAVLQEHFSLRLDELEMQWLSWLRRQPVIPDLQEDVTLSVRYYTLVRQYQQALDPSAYFRTAWLVKGGNLRAKGIVADVMRHPDEPINVVLETLLVGAGASLRAGRYVEASRWLGAVEAVLRGLRREEIDPLNLHPLARTGALLAEMLSGCGVELQQLSLLPEDPLAWGIAVWPELEAFPLQKEGDVWVLADGCLP
jgi:hypothetical protein